MTARPIFEKRLKILFSFVLKRPIVKKLKNKGDRKFMTEKEKMLQGLLYDANSDAELVAQRRYARQLCAEYNLLPYGQTEKRKRLIKRLFNRIGKDFLIEPSFQCDYGWNICAGDNFYINCNGVILDAAPVCFGNNVFIGPCCGFYTASHPLEVSLRNKGLETARPITVGDNVWIGGHVCVLSGVTIGENAVIGAGSVVTKDIPSNVVAVGNPCRVIRENI